MKKSVFLFFAMVFIAALVSSPAQAAVKVGAKCTVLGQSKNAQNKKFTCVKSGKKLIWSSNAVAKRSTPTPIAPQTPGTNPLNEVSVNENASGDFLKPEACNLESNFSHYTSVAYPIQSSIQGTPLVTLPKKGNIKALVIPVDFPQSRSQSNPRIDFKVMTEGTRDFFASMSYGSLNFTFEIPSKYFNLGKNPNDYNTSKWQSDQLPYFLDGLNAASSTYKLGEFDVVYVVGNPKIPFQAITPGPGFFGPFSVKNETVYLGSSAGSFMNPRDSWRWMVHETGHLFGLVDLYGTGPNYSDDDDRHRFFGDWDIMSQNWKTSPIEMNAWFRYQLGWISESEMLCTSLENINDRKTLAASLSAIPIKNNSVKMIVIRLSQKKSLVLESRRPKGFDVFDQRNSGVLAYVIDAAKEPYEGPFQIIRPARSKDKMLLDAPLRMGESVIFDGLKITSLKSGKLDDLIRLEKS